MLPAIQQFQQEPTRRHGEQCLVNKQAHGLLLAVVVLASLAGCNLLDPYSDKFVQVAIGDSRARLVSVMGSPPASVSSVELPLVQVEQLAWRSRTNARVYLSHVFMGRVVSKIVIE